MSFLSKIFASSAAQPIEAVGNVLDKLFTSDEEELSKKILLAKLAQEPGIAQVELNKVEAQHRSLFVAGWRPFVGWICGLALLYNFIIRDIISYILITNYPETILPPELAMTHLMTVLMGMLGMGGLRTIEKLTGKAK